jgi:thioredoxin-related protein
MQRTGPKLGKAWSTDPARTIAAGKEDRRPVALFFRAAQLDDTTQSMISQCLNHEIVARQLVARNCLAAVAVIEQVSSSELAQAHRIESLPTLVVFSADGRESDRRSGYVGPAEVADMIAKAAK